MWLGRGAPSMAHVSDGTTGTLGPAAGPALYIRGHPEKQLCTGVKGKKGAGGGGCKVRRWKPVSLDNHGEAKPLLPLVDAICPPRLFPSHCPLPPSPCSVVTDGLHLSPRIPGRLNDRRTPLGELNWIFTAITDTIAWNVLPRGEAVGPAWAGRLWPEQDTLCGLGREAVAGAGHTVWPGRAGWVWSRTHCLWT